MVYLTKVIDRATGYIFVPSPNDPQANPAPAGATNANAMEASKRPNTYALFSSAMGSLSGPGLGHGVRDVQERWVDAREVYDASETRDWRREGEIARQATEAKKEAPH
jgi:GPN-loop GTPase